MSRFTDYLNKLRFQSINEQHCWVQTADSTTIDIQEEYGEKRGRKSNEVKLKTATWWRISGRELAKTQENTGRGGGKEGRNAVAVATYVLGKKDDRLTDRSASSGACKSVRRKNGCKYAALRDARGATRCMIKKKKRDRYDKGKLRAEKDGNEPRARKNPDKLEFSSLLHPPPYASTLPLFNLRCLSLSSSCSFSLHCSRAFSLSFSQRAPPAILLVFFAVSSMALLSRPSSRHFSWDFFEDFHTRPLNFAG